MPHRLPPRFINWRAVERDGKKTKVPTDALGNPIDANDPANWKTYNDALAAGPVGFVISDRDNLIFLDFDNAAGPTDWKMEAAQLMQPFVAAGAAVEVSQSGKGLHVIGRVADKAAFADRRNRWAGPNGIGCEFYAGGRFVAFGTTGWQGDFSADITAAVDQLVPRRETSPELPQQATAPTLDDAKIIERALTHRGSAASAFGSRATFADLWNGNAQALAVHFPSPSGQPFDHSAADMALAMHLAFWCNRDAATVERLFSASALGRRSKWTDRADYRVATVRQAVGSVTAGYDRPQVPATGTGLANIWNPQNQITENAVALGFAEQEQGRILYTDAGFWWWDEDRGVWQRDTNQKVFSKVREFCDRETGGLKEHTTLKFINAVLKLASADRRLVGRMDDFDSDDWKLNTPTGIVDLRSGALLKHDPRFLMTKIAGTGFDPNAQCPHWLAFLNEIFERDQGRIEYWQRILGCCLTGDISEHVIIFAYGTGTNGKSVSLDVARGIMGDYACETQAETLMFKRGGPSHPTELAALHGARMVFASELEDGKQWDIARLKKLTGDQTITARFMGKDFFTFARKFKLLIVGNHQPELRAVDEAIRRRLRLLPYGVTIAPEKRIPNLSDKLLAAEAPGILAWAVQGCLSWQAHRMPEPDAVRIATNEYLDDEDWIGNFLKDLCDVSDPHVMTPVMMLFEIYKPWAERRGEKFIASMKRFSKALRDNGFIQYRTNEIRGYRGIKIRNGVTLPFPR